MPREGDGKIHISDLWLRLKLMGWPKFAPRQVLSALGLYMLTSFLKKFLTIQHLHMKERDALEVPTYWMLILTIAIALNFWSSTEFYLVIWNSLLSSTKTSEAKVCRRDKNKKCESINSFTEFVLRLERHDKPE